MDERHQHPRGVSLASAALLLVTGALFAEVAWADGGLIISQEVSVSEVPGGTQAAAALSGAVSSNGQRAVLWLNDSGCWELIVDPGTIEVSGAAWVLPLPVAPSEIEAASADFIDQLDAATQPVLITEHREVITHYREVTSGDGGRDGFGCGSSAALSGDGTENAGDEWLDGGDDEQGVDDGVRRWQSGRIGALDYEVISSDDPGALETWLDEQGYLVPEGISPILADYVAEGQVFFAARLAREPDQEGGVPVFRFTLCGLDAPVYPIRLTVLSVARALDFTLWIVTPASGSGFQPQGQRLGEFGSFFEPESWGYEVEPDVPDFEELYLARRRELHSLEGGRGLAVEYSGTLSDESTETRMLTIGGGDFPLTDDRSSWSPELRELIADQTLRVTRLSGSYDLDVMDQDILFEPGELVLSSGIYQRQVIVESEVWDPPEAPAAAVEEEIEPIFGEPACRVTTSRRTSASGPLLAFLLVLGALILRRAGRNGRGC